MYFGQDVIYGNRNSESHDGRIRKKLRAAIRGADRGEATSGGGNLPQVPQTLFCPTRGDDEQSRADSGGRQRSARTADDEGDGQDAPVRYRGSCEVRLG